MNLINMPRQPNQGSLVAYVNVKSDSNDGEPCKKRQKVVISSTKFNFNE